VEDVLMMVRRAGTVALVAAGLLASPDVASATVSVLYSYSGSDYTVNGDNGYAIWACDREDDGHDVKGQYYKNANKSQLVVFTNHKGAGTCYYANSTSSPIYRHRVVEVVPLSADDNGSWVYPR
jgi:hypothetical protein